MGLSKYFSAVNKKLLPVKFHYFLFMSALSCALPFRSVFAKQLGISATALGVIFSAIPFLKVITNPLFGFVLDYFKRFRLTISVIMITVAVLHVAMIFIPSRATLSFNDINYIENNFYSKVEFVCLIGSEVKEHYIIAQSSWNNHLKENNFICDINCSHTGISDQRESEQYCKEDPSFQFKITVDINNCNTDIQLKNRKLYTMHDNIRRVIGNINETSADYRKLRGILFNQTFSHEINLHSKTSPFLNFNHLIKNFNESTEIPNVIREIEKLDPNLTLTYSTNDKKTKCYNLQGYKINSRKENCNKSCPCKSEVQCAAVRCFPKLPADEVNSQKLTIDENEFLSIQFWSLFILFSISSVTLSAVIFMVDTVCYELLQDKREKYGEQRLWGTIGWGIGALTGGYLNQLVSYDSEINYAPSFFLLVFLILFDLIPVYQLKVVSPVFSSHIWKDVCLLLSKVDIAYNIIVVYTIGALSGFIWNYQFWFMEEIGASQVLLGLSQTFECLVVEVPCFLAAGWIIKKFGYAQCNNLTFLCFGLRYLCFAFMYDPWMTLPVGLFHGPTFGIFYASMTAYAKKEAPPGTEATVQSLLHLSFEGLGVATGCFFGGLGIDKFGSRETFMYSAEISFLLLFVNILMGVILSRYNKKC